MQCSRFRLILGINGSLGIKLRDRRHVGKCTQKPGGSVEDVSFHY